MHSCLCHLLELCNSCLLTRRFIAAAGDVVFALDRPLIATATPRQVCAADSGAILSKLLNGRRRARRGVGGREVSGGICMDWLTDVVLMQGHAGDARLGRRQ